MYSESSTYLNVSLVNFYHSQCSSVIECTLELSSNTNAKI